MKNKKVGKIEALEVKVLRTAKEETRSVKTKNWVIRMNVSVMNNVWLIGSALYDLSTLFETSFFAKYV